MLVSSSNIEKVTKFKKIIFLLGGEMPLLPNSPTRRRRRRRRRTGERRRRKEETESKPKRHRESQPGANPIKQFLWPVL